MKDSPLQPEADGRVRCSAWLGGWLPVEQTKPETYSSVIVAGVLEDEEWPDSHEGFWCGRNWWSVRSREGDHLAKRRINNVTHWMARPNPPNDTLCRPAGDAGGAQDNQSKSL